MKKNKKGFTLTELIVVIVIIAILAAVLIPTYTGIVKKARISADTQLVKSMNDALTLAEIEDGKPETMTDALDAIKEGGYIVENLTPTTSHYDIVWSQVTGHMSLLDENGNKVYSPDDTLAANWALWKVAKTVDDISLTNAYSYYLTDSISGAIIAKAGIDVGENEDITSITYSNTTGSAQNVIIRANGGSISITDTNSASKQTLYGKAASVTVATGNDCLYSHAIVGAMKVTQGKVIADKGAYVGIVEASSGTTLEEQNGGVFVIPTNADATKIDSTVAGTIGYTISGTTITPNEGKTDKSYYTISDKTDLYTFRTAWNDGTISTSPANVKFVDNIEIDLTDAEWDPIGTWQYPFNGTIDGMGCTINGLHRITTDSTTQWSTGATTGYGNVFGFIAIAGGGEIKISNISFTGVNISLGSGKQVATLIGYAPNNADFTNSGKGGAYWSTAETEGKIVLPAHYGKDSITIENITTSGSVSASEHVGGIIGKVYATGNFYMRNCINNCAVSSTAANNVGGIFGYYNNSSSELSETEFVACKNNGVISGPNSIAGMGKVGMENSNAVVLFENCENTGSLMSTNTEACGIASSSGGNCSVKFKDCVNSGNITAKLEAAGIYGNTFSSTKSVIFEGKTKVSGTITITDSSDSKRAACGVMCNSTQATSLSGEKIIRINAEFVITCTLVSPANANTAQLWIE